jgi:hypothetical protein
MFVAKVAQAGGRIHSSISIFPIGALPKTHMYNIVLCRNTSDLTPRPAINLDPTCLRLKAITWSIDLPSDQHLRLIGRGWCLRMYAAVSDTFRLLYILWTCLKVLQKLS